MTLWKKKKKTKQWKCVLTGKMPKITLINTPADPSSQISHWLEFMERSIKLPNLHLYNFTLNFKGGQYFPLEAEYSTNKKVEPSPYQVVILFIDDKATTSPKNQVQRSQQRRIFNCCGVLKYNPHSLTNIITTGWYVDDRTSAEKIVIPEFVYSSQMQTTAHPISSPVSQVGYKYLSSI